MSLSAWYNAEPHGRETSTQMDSDRSRRSITSPVFHQSKSGSAPQGHTKESLRERFTTADNQVSQLLAVFDYDSGRLSSDIRLLRYSSHYRQNIVLYGSGRSTGINSKLFQFKLYHYPSFINHFDLLVDYSPGKAIDRHVHPITLFTIDDKAVLKTCSIRRIPPGLRDHVDH